MLLLKLLGVILLTIIGIVLTYLGLSILGMLIPVNRKQKQPSRGRQIYLTSDGIHTDFVLPSKNDLFDWSTVVDSQPYQTSFSEDSFLAFGWGDRGFYLDIPTWSDLTPAIAIRAMCLPSPTLVHIYSYKELPTTLKYFESVILSDQQYLNLCDYIHSFFKLNDGKIELIPGVGYTPDDNFYTAKFPYHAFHTCNYWVNRGLKKIGVRTAIWSPGAMGIFRHLP